MPFERGTFSLTIFKLTKDLPDDALERFNSMVAGKLDDVKDEQQIGWVSGRHLLERRIDDETAFLGGHIYLNLRTAQRKVPSALLNAEAKMEELAYIKSTGKSDVPRKVRREIKDDIIEKRLPQMVPSISGIPVVIDQTDNTVYLGATSVSQIDTFLACFNDSVDIAPIQVTAEEIMIEEKFDPRSYVGISLADNNNDEDYSPGRDFLTWLWYFSEEENGTIEVSDYGRFAIGIDGPLSFIADGKGALESVVRKGNPLKSAEARAALSVGKKLKKAKLIICREKETWNTGFDADSFTFSSVGLPEGEEMDLASRFAERINNLHIFKTVFRALFVKFLYDLKEDKREEKVEKIKKWITARETY
ncbi:MAG: recombination-associated protein RdgC [Victivallales bacterium]|nr:recombination-associated protein RdgC [Victivallales bacterium]MCF7888529.1 recombination-associated protein RdgC [Victivallales bacterium]